MSTPILEPQPLSPIASFVLTRRLPCALLLATMVGGFAVLAGAFPGHPLLATLLGLAAVALNMLAPALVALITYGGGLSYALQVSALASLMIGAAAGFSMAAGIWTFAVYGLVVAMAAQAFIGKDGVRRSAQWIAAGLALCLALGLGINAWQEGIGLQQYAERLIRPFFAGLQVPENNPDAAAALTRSQAMMARILPGLLGWAMWVVWWGNIILARTIAMRHGFFDGERHDVLDLRFGKPWAYLFLLALLGANFAGGEAQFIALNAALLIGGLLAAQGVVVVHSWFKARNMQFLVGLMYVMLFFWTAMIVPFVIVGLMDIWFDFRRNINPAHGGE